MSRNASVALVGILFLAAILLSFVIPGEPPDPTSDSAEEVAQYYVDNDGAVMAGSYLMTLAGALFVVFAAAIRRILREAGGEDDTVSTIALAGAIIFAVGAAASGTISFAAADLVDDVDPVAINTINAIAWDWFLPFAAGVLLFFLATGIGIVRTGALPKWLGWIAILIGVVALTPIGFGAAGAGAVWILIASIVIGMRGSTA